MRPRSHSTRFHNQGRPAGARLLMSAVKIAMVLGLILVAGWFFFQDAVRSKLAQTIERKINEAAVPNGLVVNLGDARFIEGRGIALNNISIDQSPLLGAGAVEFNGYDAPVADFYDAFVHLPVSMADLVLGNAKPQGIDVRRARLSLVREADGQWQIGKLLSRFKPTTGANPIPVNIQDSEIRILDYTRNPPLERRLTDVQINFRSFLKEGRELSELTFRCRGSELGGLHVSVLADLQSSDFDLHFSSDGVRLSPVLFSLLPAHIARQFDRVKSLTGSLKTEGRAIGNLQDSIPQFMVSGTVDQFSIDDERLPVPLTRASASFLVSDQEIRISSAQGRVGNGEFKIDYQQKGLLSPETWQATGMAKDFAFHHAIALSHLFPKGCTQFCDDFSPQGICNLDFKFGHNGRSKFRAVNAKLRETSFQFVKFPYFVDQCQGRVDLVDDVMTVDLKSLASAVPMRVSGTIVNPGMDATYQLDLVVPGAVPIDEKLLEALDVMPPLARVVRAFEPGGRVGGKGTFIKRVPRGQADKYFDVELKDVAIRHTAFPYPIRNITGVISSSNLDFVFRDLVGHNGNGSITCSGSWNPRKGLDCQFDCVDVQLDDRLRFALSADLQGIWNGFVPAGQIPKMKVDMTMPFGEKVVGVIVDADLHDAQTGQSNVSIFPHWFPYEIKQLSGNVRIGDGRIAVSKIRGKHDQAWLACQGTGRYSDESWAVTLRELLATSVKVDEDLLSALPTSLAPPVRQMKFQGLFNVQGEITVAGVHQAVPATGGEIDLGKLPDANFFCNDPTMAWDLNFSMSNAKMLVGLPLKSVFGSVQLQGIYDGKRAESKGELEIDAMNIYGAQITDVKGPIWMDNDRVSAGALVAPPVNTAVAGFNPQSSGPLTGNAYGGVLKFDATMANDNRGEFYIQTTMADGDIEEASLDFAPEVNQVAGRGFIAMRMGGNYADTHSYRGDGTVQLRNAKIVELPAISALLKTLNVGRTDRTALFDSSNVNFLINGTDIDFERIELLGDAISLIGNGRMNLNQELDLNFYSIVGRNRIRIPVLNELYHVGSQRILWISVDGTVSNPQMSRQVLPQLNDSIRLLFQGPGGVSDPNGTPLFQNRIERNAILPQFRKLR